LRQTTGQDGHRPLFNAAQAWNHAFYWRSLKPNGGGGVPVGEIAKRIDSDFGGYARFAEQFRAAAVGQFGSGWAWLMLDGNTLKGDPDRKRRHTACLWGLSMGKPRCSRSTSRKISPGLAEQRRKSAVLPARA
jgi:Iron/manganese superoxide dismutases, C-terminal domain